MKTIDMTPTWEGLVPALIHILQHSKSDRSKHDIADELTKMARAADRWNAYCREQNTIVRQEVGA
jgi:hypothetical protein